MSRAIVYLGSIFQGTFLCGSIDLRDSSTLYNPKVGKAPSYKLTYKLTLLGYSRPAYFYSPTCLYDASKVHNSIKHM